MLERLFEHVVVDEAVAVFCHDGGFSEYAVSRPLDTTVIGWLSAYKQPVNKARTSLQELRVVDFGTDASRVPPAQVTGLPPKRGKGRARQRPLDFMANQSVETSWGPAVLVDECDGGGWNVDFGDEYTNHFWLAPNEFVSLSGTVIVLLLAFGL